MTDTQRQHLLAYLGYYKLTVDGDWGSGSREACKAFQRDRNLTVNGYGDPETDKALRYAVGNDLQKAEPDYDEDINVPDKTGTFWDEIEYFTRDEFKCKCGGKYCNGYPAEPDERMVRIADQLRKNLGVPITIVSGLRCKTWNAIQGGVANSQHMYGEAADIYAKGVSQSRVEAELDKIGGVRYHYPIKGSNNVHFDVPKGNR
jgi:peptidoglycan hydrolase-like protein with peptidoglycan-binding domain